MKLDLNPPGTVAYLNLQKGRGEATYRDINEPNAARLAGATALCALRIDAPSMPRPKPLLDALSHLPALRDVAARIRRVAVVSDTPPVEFMDFFRKHFASSEVRHFTVAAQRAADHWLSLAEVSSAPEETPRTADEQPGAITLEETDAAVDDEIDDWFIKG